jgi:hypothetical protein
MTACGRVAPWISIMLVQFRTFCWFPHLWDKIISSTKRRRIQHRPSQTMGDRIWTYSRHPISSTAKRCEWELTRQYGILENGSWIRKSLLDGQHEGRCQEIYNVLHIRPKNYNHNTTTHLHGSWLSSFSIPISIYNTRSLSWTRLQNLSVIPLKKVSWRQSLLGPEI